jgi:para-aminobenzoate synthetase component 1
MLNWANQFNIFCFLDNLQDTFKTADFECMLAAGSTHQLKANAGNAFNQLKDFAFSHREEWLFGHICYDLKNETEQLVSLHFDGIRFPDIHFFVPAIIVRLNKNELQVICDDYKAAVEIVASIQAAVKVENFLPQQHLQLENRISKEEYLDKIKGLKQHILQGDCYEINLCQEWFATDAEIEPITVYKDLVALSPNPFAVLYKLDDRFCISASPERYLKKSAERIFSQPMKGTAKRNLQSQLADDKNKQQLLESEKEKSENVMVVDLVRNDLSRICKKGSVKVDELFGIYSFPQVHQMISTVSGEIEDGFSWVDAIKATFPMGSMTGAPKKRVMELIEEFEETKRGLFSGSIGYINPTGDFDFNVVIRSIFYNAINKYLSFQTGSAITFYCDAEKEYEECLLKAGAMKAVLER